jgi:hypothetical protein
VGLGRRNLRLGRGAQSAVRRRSDRRLRLFWSRSRLSFSFSPPRRRLRSPRPPWPAPRSQPSLRRSSATPPNSASKSATTRPRPSTRRPAIVAINVRCAASPRKPRPLSRQTCQSCPAELMARRTRSARRRAKTFFPLIPPSRIRPGLLPSQSDGHWPTRAFRRCVRIPSDSRTPHANP